MNGASNDLYSIARIMLGDDFISPEELGANEDTLPKRFPSMAAVGWCRDVGAILIAPPPIPRSIHDIVSPGLDDSPKDQILRESLCERVPTKSWLAIRKEVVPGSRGSNVERAICLAPGHRASAKCP